MAFHLAPPFGDLLVRQNAIKRSADYHRVISINVAFLFSSSIRQKEQMIEAQEMFKNSNKVTRPEKALILGFMAGSRGLLMRESMSLLITFYSSLI